MRSQQEGHGGTSLNLLPFPSTGTQDVNEAFYSKGYPKGNPIKMKMGIRIYHTDNVWPSNGSLLTNETLTLK